MTLVFTLGFMLSFHILVVFLHYQAASICHRSIKERIFIPKKQLARYNLFAYWTRSRSPFRAHDTPSVPNKKKDTLSALHCVYAKKKKRFGAGKHGFGFFCALFVDDKKPNDYMSLLLLWSWLGADFSMTMAVHYTRTRNEEHTVERQQQCVWW